MLKKLDRAFRRFFPKRLTGNKEYLEIFRNLKGIEVGGPSPAFSTRGWLPIYRVIAGLDGCNFSSNTIWEGSIREGNTFKYDDKTGYQYISDATDLSQVPDDKYDFLLSCHSLEHIANPIKALNEWKRIVKNNGYFLFVLPHKDGTFDHRRPVTTLKHVIADYDNNTTEHDTTHFDDAINLHDISKDHGIDSYEALTERTKNNFENRSVHHHIFNTPFLVSLVDQMKLKVLRVTHFSPFHIIVLAQKTDQTFSNAEWLSKRNPVYINSRFPSDRL
ncbi:MAG: class I SAM-dependent methyltransferase [Flavitalea sp.]